MSNYPSREEFLALPTNAVHDIAPQTVILTNGGTRRHAVLAGVSPVSDAYAHWTRVQMINCLSLIFGHGIQHIFTTVLAETNYNEVTPGYREKLAQWIEYGLASPKALDDYAARNWRVRLMGTESWPELQEIALRIQEATSTNSGPRLWFMASSSDEHHWEKVFSVVQENHGLTRAQIIRKIYGEDIPLATLYIGSGKPQITTSNVPAILIGSLQCYWRQHLGYDLDELTLRKILYDYAYLRKTWEKDKSGRAEKALAYRSAWDDPPVLGIGTKLGPFWYPAPHDGLSLTELTQENGDSPSS